MVNLSVSTLLYACKTDFSFVAFLLSLIVEMATNETNYTSLDDCKATNKALYTFYAAVMILIIVLALPLNASVLHLFIFKLKFWKSNTNNIFLFNLVLADILLLFYLPINTYNYLQGELSGNYKVCKAMLFMLFLNRGASIAFLTVISIDRYFKVVHPNRTNLIRYLKKSPQISILIWVLLLPLTVPTMLKDFDCCNSHKSDVTESLVKVMCKLSIFLLCIYLPSFVCYRKVFTINPKDLVYCIR